MGKQELTHVNADMKKIGVTQIHAQTLSNLEGDESYRQINSQVMLYITY